VKENLEILSQRRELTVVVLRHLQSRASVQLRKECDRIAIEQHTRAAEAAPRIVTMSDARSVFMTKD